MRPELALVVGAATVTAVPVARALGRGQRRAALSARLGPGAGRPGVGGSMPRHAHRVARISLGALCGGIVGGPVVALLGGLTVALGEALAPVLRRARRHDRYDAEIVAFLSAFARGLRSGAPVHTALAESAAPIEGALADDLALLLDRLDRGCTVVDGLRRWADERPRPAVRATAAALALGHDTGGLRAEVVDSVAASVRQRLDTRAEARGLATQARASAVVLASAPLVFLLLGLVSGSGATQFLLGTPVGLVCLAIGLLLDGAAFAAMLHLVAAVGR